MRLRATKYQRPTSGRSLVVAHADADGEPLRAAGPAEALELEPGVPHPLDVAGAADEVPLHVLVAGAERVELLRADVAVEAERQQQLERLRLAGGVVAAQQQPAPGEIEHLVGVLVEVDDAGAPRPPARGAGAHCSALRGVERWRAKARRERRCPEPPDGPDAASEVAGEQDVGGGCGQRGDLLGIVGVAIPVAAVLGDEVSDGVAQRLEAQLPVRAGVGERVAQQERDLLEGRVRRERHVGERPVVDDQRAALGPPLDLVAGRGGHRTLDSRALAEEVRAVVVVEVGEQQHWILGQPPGEALGTGAVLALRGGRIPSALVDELIKRGSPRGPRPGRAAAAPAAAGRR